MSRVQWKFRDVSTLLKSLRNLLLGRKHTLHPRFPCAVAPRSIPPPDIPRGPHNKYSEMYYDHRSPFSAVFPPVVAPVAMGAKDCKTKPESLSLSTKPTPGSPWWWDGHSYYECADPVPDQRAPCPPTAPPPPPPACGPPPSPLCPQAPDKMAKH